MELCSQLELINHFNFSDYCHGLCDSSRRSSWRSTLLLLFGIILGTTISSPWLTISSYVFADFLTKSFTTQRFFILLWYQCRVSMVEFLICTKEGVGVVRLFQWSTTWACSFSYLSFNIKSVCTLFLKL